MESYQIQQTSEYNKKEADSQTQQTNQWGEGRRKAQYRVRGVTDTNY